MMNINERKDVSQEMSIEKLFANCLLHLAVDTGNKQMFDELHAGTYEVIKDDGKPSLQELLRQIPSQFEVTSEDAYGIISHPKGRVGYWSDFIADEYSTFTPARQFLSKLFEQGEVDEYEFDELFDFIYEFFVQG